MSNDAPNFSLRNIFSEAVKEFGSPDRGFFRTTWLFLSAPGHTLRKILQGEEQNVTTPFRYFLLAYSLYAIIYIATGANDIAIADQVASIKQQLHSSKIFNTDQQVRDRLGFSFFIQYPLIATLIALVFLWLSSLVSFFRFKLSAGQHLSAALYFMGATTVLQLPLALLVFLNHTQWMAFVAQLLVFIYMLWTTQTYNRAAHRFGFIRGIVWFCLWQFLLLVLTITFIAKAGMTDGMKKAIEEKQETRQK